MDELVKTKIIRGTIAIVIFVMALTIVNTNSKCKELNSQVDTYKTKVVKLEKENNEYEELIESYKKSQQEDRATISEQKETIDTLENQITNLNSKINKLNVEIVSLTNERDTANKKITELNGTITNLNSKITTLDNTIISNETKITDLTNKLKTANTQITDLTNKNNTLTNKVTDLETKLNTINTNHVVNNEEELLEAFKKGGNVILNADILMSNAVVLKDKLVSIDLKGHNLVASTIELTSSNLEIKDSTNIGKLTIVGENEDLSKGIKVNETSSVKITNGNYEGKNLLQVIDDGTLYVVGGTFNNKQEEIINKTDNAKVEILGGSFKE